MIQNLEIFFLLKKNYLFFTLVKFLYQVTFIWARSLYQYTQGNKFIKTLRIRYFHILYIFLSNLYVFLFFLIKDCFEHTLLPMNIGALSFAFDSDRNFMNFYFTRI